MDAAAQRRGQARLELAAGARRQPLGLEARAALQVVDAAQLRGLVAVERDVQGAVGRVAGRHPARLLELGDEARVELGGDQGQLEQLGLAEGQLADRRQHPGGDPGRPGRRLRSRSSTTTPAPRLGQAPGAGEADDPTANDYRVVTALLAQFASAGITRIRSRRSVASVPPSQPSRAPVHLRCYPSPRTTSGQVHNRAGDEPGTPRGRRPAAPRAAAHRPPLLRLRRPPARRRPRAAAAGGAGRRRRHRPAAREGRCRAARSSVAALTFRRLCDTYSALFIVNDDPELARACDADGVHVGQDDTPRRARRASCSAPEAIVGLSTHSEEQIAASAEAAGRLHQRRPGLGDADQRGPARRRPRARLARRRSTRPTPSSRSAASTRRTPTRWSTPAPAGSAWCGRSATPRPRRRRPNRCGRRSAAIGEAAPGG